MGNWTVPPAGGHVELSSEIYCHMMRGHQIEERLSKKISSSQTAVLKTTVPKPVPGKIHVRTGWLGGKKYEA